MEKYSVTTNEFANLNSTYDHLKRMKEEMLMNPSSEFDKTKLDELSDRISEIEELMKKAYCVGALVDWPTLKRIIHVTEMDAVYNVYA